MHALARTNLAALSRASHPHSARPRGRSVEQPLRRRAALSDLIDPLEIDCCCHHRPVGHRPCARSRGPCTPRGLPIGGLAAYGLLLSALNSPLAFPAGSEGARTPCMAAGQGRAQARSQLAVVCALRAPCAPSPLPQPLLGAQCALESGVCVGEAWCLGVLWAVVPLHTHTVTAPLPPCPIFPLRVLRGETAPLPA
ncbi:MAG: hypothetical protein J3K34DRAFT_416143 [Monoraphidium minutum]|nr:MAG: hypothetical protein J3K34DRAFT_416143 [Monoraphidium minutum]